MSSKRKLKKAIKNICGELFADCAYLRMCPAQNKENLEELMLMVMSLYTDFVARVQHADKANTKEYYKTLRSEFSKQVNRLSQKIIEA